MRLDYDLMPELKLGGYTQAADFSYGTRARHGLNVRYTTEQYYVRVEAAMQSANNDTLKSNGIVAEAGYNYEKWQPVAHFETYNPNTSATVSGKAITLGVNYYINKHKAKVQLAATDLIDMSALNGTPSVASGSKGTVMYLAFSSSL